MTWNVRHSPALLLAVAICLLPVAHASAQSGITEFGVSGGSIADISKLYCCGGTLGSLINLNGADYILSNNHVLARTNQGVPGDLIIRPGLIDQTPVCSQDERDAVGTLFAFQPISFNKRTVNYVDAAIALPSVAVTNKIRDIKGTPSKDPLDPSVNLPVQKTGRTTGHTTGAIAYVNVTVNVGYQPTCGMGKQQTAKFVNQFIVTPGDFSAGGDSGSVIFDMSNPPRPVGLLFAGSSSYTIANRMTDVITALTGLKALAANTPGSDAAGRVADIKDRYDDFLYSLPEVVGHGVGVSSQNPNELAIQLLVRKANENIRRAAPRALEGVLVEIVETGEFRATPSAAPACQPRNGR